MASTSIQEPWVSLGISRGSWFRANNKGVDPATIKGRMDISPTRPLYRTLKQAATAARRLRIKTRTEYRARYSEDRKLPSCPDTYYRGWKNWKTFLGSPRRARKPREVYYLDLYAAAKAAGALGCTRTSTSTEYRSLWYRDERLPSHPDYFYRKMGWNGWEHFFGLI